MIMQNWLWSAFVFPMPPSLLLPLLLQKALAMCVLTAQQNLLSKSPSRHVLAAAVLFTAAVLVSLPTGKQATSTRVSPNELRTASATRATTNPLGKGLCGLVAGTELYLEKRNSKPPFKENYILKYRFAKRQKRHMQMQGRTELRIFFRKSV